MPQSRYLSKAAVDLINREQINVIVLPGREAVPLRAALKVLAPQARIISDEKLVKIGEEKKGANLLAADSEIMGLKDRTDARILCLVDAIKSGRTPWNRGLFWRRLLSAPRNLFLIFQKQPGYSRNPAYLKPDCSEKAQKSRFYFRIFRVK